MAKWLFKSEPNCFSIDDLIKKPKKTGYWDGVRNYQVRNLLRDTIKVGDQCFFYHSSCVPPGIVGIAEVVKNGYPDFTAWDIHSDHFDPKSTPENPRWYMVDIKFVAKFSEMFTLEKIKSHPKLKSMAVAKKGSRLSITSVTADEWKIITKLAKL